MQLGDGDFFSVKPLSDDISTEGVNDSWFCAANIESVSECGNVVDSPFVPTLIWKSNHVFSSFLCATEAAGVMILVLFQLCGYLLVKYHCKF